MTYSSSFPSSGHAGGRAWRDGQVRLLAFWLCIGLSALSVLRPTFNFYSYAAARISDFAAIGLLALVSLIAGFFAREFPVRTMGLRLVWAIAFCCCILIALIGQGLTSHFAIDDFADLARPALMLFSITAGYFMTLAFCRLRDINVAYFLLGALAAAIAAFQTVDPHAATFIWKIYSVQNALGGFGTGRPTAFFYHFTELAEVLVLCGLIAFAEAQRGSVRRRLVFVVLGVSFIASSTLSTSRIGLIFLVVAALYYMLDDLVSRFSISRVATYTFLFFLAAGGVTALFLSDPRYSSLFSIMWRFLGNVDFRVLAHVDNTSIANRAKQVLIYLDVLTHHDYRIIIGNGPMRYVNQNYFEIDWIKFLFRYGVLGFLVYYSLFLYSLFERGSRNAASYVKVVRACCLAYFATDALATSSEIVKGISTFLFWYGAVLAERDKDQILDSSGAGEETGETA